MSARATYRLQLHRGFDFASAARRVDYLASLGISHLYLSPILTARPGSLHGYDVVDHGAVNPELGGEQGLLQLCAATRARGLGIVVDIVPNHMAVGGDNAWWVDVLEWGMASRYARHFDIDWRPGDPAIDGKVVVPALARPYADALAAGELHLGFDARVARLVVRHGEQAFPVAPRDYAAVIGSGPVPLPGLARSIARLAEANDEPGARRRAVRGLQRQFAEAVAAAGGEAALAPALALHSPVTAAGAARLHLLLERQNYRLTSWRAAPDLINWRRFFDINDLAALRIEDEAVFDAVHATTLRLHAEGIIDGVRVDHVDGLADPEGYCRRLRAALDTGGAARPRNARPGRALLWVEKILARDENLPAEWPVDGTTGYDFMNEVAAVLHDREGEPALTRLWQRIAGGDAGFESAERIARREILARAFPAQLDALVRRFRDVAVSDPRLVEIGQPALRRSLEALLARFRAYRPYARATGLSAADRRRLVAARDAARDAGPPGEVAALDAVTAVLDAPSGDEARGEAGVRFAQLSAALAAKAVEDTAFYRYGRLLSRNDVGFDADRLACDPDEFHRFCARRAAGTPRTLNATATHDHKRGEDTRARLAILSEMAPVWEELVQSLLPGGSEGGVDGVDAAMLAQAIVGAWPASLRADDREGLAALGERLGAWQVKALREAKRRSAWSAPDEEYERACRALLDRWLDPQGESCAALGGFVARIAAAAAVNGLAQTLLKLTAPGIPDLYQGTEGWDWSLVDPDNRAPVDFDSREASLRAAEAPDALLGEWRDGRVKQAVIARALALRAERPRAFAEGYTPLAVTGIRALHVLAFARGEGAGAVIVAVTRLPARLLGDAAQPLPPSERWGDTAIELPDTLRGTGMRDVLVGSSLPAADRVLVRDAFSRLPVALLVADSEPAASLSG